VREALVVVPQIDRGGHLPTHCPDDQEEDCRDKGRTTATTTYRPGESAATGTATGKPYSWVRGSRLTSPITGARISPGRRSIH
jgi:hypothetical protein